MLGIIYKMVDTGAQVQKNDSSVQNTNMPDIPSTIP